MAIIDLLVLGIVIGSNNFAVALALGALGQSPRRYRIMLVFGLIEFVVPLLGMYLGASTTRIFGFHSIYISAVLLFGIGLLAVFEGSRTDRDDERLARLVTQWQGLFVLGAGLSLDNLVVGFGLGFSEQPLAVAGTISFFAVLFTWIGIQIGHASRRYWEQKVKIATGILLMLLGMITALGWLA